MKADVLTKLAKKLATVETANDAMAVLKAVGDPDALLAALARGGHLPLSTGAGALLLFGNWAKTVEVAAVIAWFEGLTVVGDDDWGESLPGLAWPIRKIVSASYAVAPAAWDAVVATGRKRDAILLARGDAKLPIPEADRARMIEELLGFAFDGSSQDPTGVAAALGLAGAAWGERTLPLLAKHPDADPWHFLDAAARSPAKLAEAMVLGVRPCGYRTAHTVLDFLRRRDDGAAWLVALVGKLAKAKHDDARYLAELVEAIGALALERAHRAGKPAPEGTEALLTGTIYDHRIRRVTIVPFASAIPAKRLQAFLTAALETPNGHLHAGMLRAANDDALVRRWVKRMCEGIAKSTEVQIREAIALGEAGPGVLPLLLDELAAAKLPKVRIGIRAAVLGIAAELARSDAEIPPSLDALLGGDDEVRNHDYAELLCNGDLLGTVLAKLPAERGAAIVKSWLALERSNVQKKLVAAVPPHLRGLVVDETPVDRIARLAGGHACDARIYAIAPYETDDEDVDVSDDDITGKVNWIGAAPVGLAKAKIPKAGTRAMKHVITFDLAAMPEVRAILAAPTTTRAIAVFASPAKASEAGEPFNDDLVYVPLSEAEATSGTGGKGRRFTITALDVPRAVLGDRVPPALADLRVAIGQLAGRALGPAMLIQELDDKTVDKLGALAMQLDGRVVDLNLGDEGLLYLYRATAFFQSH